MRPDGNGKGDKPRPIDNWEQFSNNFDAIFKKKEKVKVYHLAKSLKNIKLIHRQYLMSITKRKV
mgnify:CR=1 FL=1